MFNQLLPPLPDEHRKSETDGPVYFDLIIGTVFERTPVQVGEDFWIRQENGGPDNHVRSNVLKLQVANGHTVVLLRARFDGSDQMDMGGLHTTSVEREKHADLAGVNLSTGQRFNLVNVVIGEGHVWEESAKEMGTFKWALAWFLGIFVLLPANVIAAYQHPPMSTFERGLLFAGSLYLVYRLRRQAMRHKDAVIFHLRRVEYWFEQHYDEAACTMARTKLAARTGHDTN